MRTNSLSIAGIDEKANMRRAFFGIAVIFFGFSVLDVGYWILHSDVPAPEGISRWLDAALQPLLMFMFIGVCFLEEKLALGSLYCYFAETTFALGALYAFLSRMFSGEIKSLAALGAYYVLLVSIALALFGLRKIAGLFKRRKPQHGSG